MSLYKITVQLCSPLVTPLKGDTVWGHIVWGIANHEGDDAVLEFLKQEALSPQFIVSSGFPAGYICKPLPVPQERKARLSADEYAQIKQQKKMAYVPSGVYLDGCGQSENENMRSVFVRNTVVHNMINRQSGCVEDGSVYSVEEQWAGSKRQTMPCFDIYIETSFTAERVHELCTWAFENGYGADASVGKGYIKVIEKPQIVTPRISPKSAAEYVALGPFTVPADSGIQNLRADIFTRTGRLGGTFASESMPYKKTVVLFDEGAVFVSESPRAYIGCLLRHIHADERICQAGYAPVIPIKAKEEQ